MTRTTWTKAVLAASGMGATGRECLRLLAEHRVLELPMLTGCLGLHYSSVREAMGRLERRELVFVKRSLRDPTQPSRWFLTSLGAHTARVLSPDPDWDPRPTAAGRPDHMTHHDLALATLRLTIFRRHWREIVVQRGRRYVRNAPAVEADREFWSGHAPGQEGLPVRRESSVRFQERRRLGLPMGTQIPVESAVLIPDLFWPGSSAACPVIIEYEGRRTSGRVVWNKAVHLARYCFGKPTRVIVVYPRSADATAMRSVWRRVLRRLPPETPLTVVITSMATLWEARTQVEGGLDLGLPIPNGVIVRGTSDFQ